MKIIKVEHVETKSVGGSISDVIEIFNITCEDGTIDKFRISLWYVPNDKIYETFLQSIIMSRLPYAIDNIIEMYEMVIEEFKKLGYNF